MSSPSPARLSHWSIADVVLGPFPLAFHPSHLSGARRAGARLTRCAQPRFSRPSPVPAASRGPAPHPAEPDGRAAAGRAACARPGQGVQGWRRLARLCRRFCRPKK